MKYKQTRGSLLAAGCHTPLVRSEAAFSPWSLPRPQGEFHHLKQRDADPVGQSQMNCKRSPLKYKGLHFGLG
jgi:hypothetical protein